VGEGNLHYRARRNVQCSHKGLDRISNKQGHCGRALASIQISVRATPSNSIAARHARKNVAENVPLLSLFVIEAPVSLQPCFKPLTKSTWTDRDQASVPPFPTPSG
jgi:hypothetical protein